MALAFFDKKVQAKGNVRFSYLPSPSYSSQEQFSMRPFSKIVARSLNGHVVKGYTQDFDPDASCFCLWENPTEASEQQPVNLRMKDLKAIFFVRTFDGNPHYIERRDFIEGDRSYGDRVEVTFGDGEVVRGFRIDHYPRRSGFFLLPPDPRGNNVMVFLVSRA